MSAVHLQILLSIVGGLISLLIILLGYFGKKMDTHLHSIAESVSEIKVEIGVLSNDHSHLKEDVHDIKERVFKLESERI